MNTEIKHSWISALRSGQYRQTSGVLRDDTGFCCLGVLCDLVRPDGWEIEGNDRYHHNGLLQMPDDGILTDIDLQASFAGMLAEMNDCGSTFRQIAERIEADL